MADVNDLFLFGDDFDAIIDILEAEEVVQEQFSEAVNEVQNSRLICDLCKKTYKSKGGLKRHTSLKHQEDSARQDEEKSETFTAEILANMVDEVKLKLADNKVFPKGLRDELRSYVFVKLGEQTLEFCELRKTYEGLVKNGDAEKFYTKFYSAVPLNAMKYFEGLSRNAATLLSTKVADRMLSYSKEKAATSTPNLEATNVPLLEQEMAGLQYLGGYVLHKLHNKHVNSKISKSAESEQAISLLKAGKCKDEAENVKDTQKLINCLNRGGLWSITKSAQTIFLRTENYFRAATAKSGLQSIDINSIIMKSINDVATVSAYNTLVSDSELVICKNVGKDVLQNIVSLFVRVRSFSFAKDVIQKHKMKAKQVKAKALRKEITRANNDCGKERQP